MNGNSQSLHGFTLVELLVIIAIITTLAAFLLPTLQGAAERAMDVRCMSTMRQGLAAVFSYNADCPGGLQNYHPLCPYWGKGWKKISPHMQSNQWVFDKRLANPGPGNTWSANPDEFSNHIGSEASSLDNWWRGYLLGGGYATASALGCNVTDFRSSPYFRGGSHVMACWGTAVNTVEWDRAADSFRLYHPFLWWGPGCMAEDVRYFAGGEGVNPSLRMDTSGFVDSSGQPDPYGCTTYTGKRGPLFSCPRVCLMDLPKSIWWWDVVPHRPKRFFVRTQDGFDDPGGYAENVGYSDGSARFFFGLGDGRYNPF